MDQETKLALEGSIKKWEAIVNGTGEDEGIYNCHLCDLYFWGDHACVGCPVWKITGKGGCIGTPYEKWSNGKYITATTPKSIELAKAELEFLKGLRE